MVRSFNATRRSSFLFITIVLVMLSAGTYLATCKLDDYADSRRTSQRRISDFRRDIAGLQVSIEGRSIGEVDEELSLIRQSVKESYNLVVNGLRAEQMSLLTSAFEPFMKYADQEVLHIDEGNMQSARAVDTEKLDPAYQDLNRTLQSIDSQLAGEATLAQAESRLLLGIVLLSGTLFTIVMLWRHQDKVVSLASMHAGQKVLAASERRFQSLASNSADVITLLDRDAAIKFASGRAEAMFERPSSELVGLPMLQFCHPDDAARLFHMLNEVSERANMQATTEVRILTFDGSSRYAEVFMMNLLLNQDVAGILATFHDLTERKRLEEELVHQAFHDKLTGLPNRALLMDRLSHGLTLAQRSGNPMTVMFLDLDNFKVINDSLGHEAGDVLLIQFAERLSSVFRQSDTISRLGGDEFVVMLGGALDTSDAIVLAKRLQRECEKSFVIAGREIFVTPSIGIAKNGPFAENADALLRDADTALYQAKANGKASYVVFDRSMNDAAMERLELESELRAAIQNNEFVLNYQPIFSMESSQIVNVEALIRWQHPTRGIIPPAKFIPIAEETGLILEIGEWVLRESCMQLQAWIREFQTCEKLKVSVNVSGRQLGQPGFADKVQTILSECGIEPSKITLEITETFMLQDLNLSARVLNQLRSVGFGIAIDDFGTGYASMSYLSKLPVDTLKIDRSFIESMKKQEMGEGIVQAMIAMARTLGLNVVSEGIETPWQFDQLQQLGSDQGQGFFFAKALSVGSLTQLFASTEGQNNIPRVA